MSHDIQVGASYTYSHATDEQSGLGLFYNGNNPLNLRTATVRPTSTAPTSSTSTTSSRFPTSPRSTPSKAIWPMAGHWSA